MRVEQLTWPAWESAEPGRRAAWIAEAATRAGGTVRGDAIEVRGATLALVPGGSCQLGWDGSTTAVTLAQRTEWDANADFAGGFEKFLRYYLGPARTVDVPAFLLERSAVPVADLGIDPYDDDAENAVRVAVSSSGFRLPSNDEWEVAMRAGVHTLFAWGDAWPDLDPYPAPTAFSAHTRPNALGIVPRSNPYETEVVSERDWLRGGDGGAAVCGGRPVPEAWYSFALAFQLPRELWGDCVPETFEQAFVRRAIPL